MERSSGFDRRIRLIAGVAPLCFALQALLSALLILEGTAWLGWLIPVSGVLLVDALLVAWFLLAAPIFVRIQRALGKQGALPRRRTSESPRAGRVEEHISG